MSADTTVGAPQINAIPAAIPTIKPQETLPVKNPIPRESIAKAAKALPALPVTILRTLHMVSTKTFEFALALTVLPLLFCANAENVGKADGATVKKKKDKRVIFAKKEKNFFIILMVI